MPGTPFCNQAGKKGKSSLQYITLDPKGVAIAMDQPLDCYNSGFELNIAGIGVAGATEPMESKPKAVQVQQ